MTTDDVFKNVIRNRILELVDKRYLPNLDNKNKDELKILYDIIMSGIAKDKIEYLFNLVIKNNDIGLSNYLNVLANINNNMKEMK